ncbi:MAG: hypothetical protein GY757_01165 [bacterium]|nr:hypothetical protein [bacterium]
MRYIVWIIVLVVVFSVPVAALTVTVNTTNDYPDLSPGDGTVLDTNGTQSLRAAIEEFNLWPGPHFINLPANTYVLDRTGVGEDGCNTGDLDILQDMTIQGLVAGVVFIDGGDINFFDRIFHVLGTGVTLNLTDVTVLNAIVDGYNGGGLMVEAGCTLSMTDCTVAGNGSDYNSALLTGGLGGGICNQGTTTLSACSINGNTANDPSGTIICMGGGLYNNGTLNITGGVIATNMVMGGAVNLGGGIYNDSIGTINATSCGINTNTSTEDGGGIYNDNAITLTMCTIQSNQANTAAVSEGGGIYNNMNLIMNECTVFDNEAEVSGGGIYNVYSMVLTNCTITGNRALGAAALTGGAGIYTDLASAATQTLLNCTVTNNTATNNGGGIWQFGPPLSIQNTIIAGNTDSSAAGDIYDSGGGNIISQNYNLIGISIGSFTPGANDQVGVAASPINPLLGPLANNGGQTLTHELFAGSPALDVIPDLGGGNYNGAPGTDQRGMVRPQQSACDIGAFERDAVLLPPTITSITPNTGTNDGTVTIDNLAGTDFTAGATVHLAMTGQPDIATNWSNVASATRISCAFDLTGAVAGAWDVVVTNPDAQTGTLTGGFTVTEPVAAISAITPNTGTNDTTVDVTITGTNFQTGASAGLIRTGQPGIFASGIIVVSETEITCTFDLNGVATGVWDLFLQNTSEQEITLAGAFTVNDAGISVTAITPNTGTNNAAVNVTVTGTNFLTGLTARLQRTGETAITGTAITVESDTQFTCSFDLNGAAAGNWDLYVENSSTNNFTYTGAFSITNPPPVITAITPTSGLGTGTVTITVTGEFFQAGAAVSLRMETPTGTKAAQTIIEAETVTFVSATTVTSLFDLTGAAAGVWDVVLENPDTQSFTLSDGFTIGYPAPTATGITPNSGRNNETVSITNLSGTNFREGVQVRLRKESNAGIKKTQQVIVAGSIGVVSGERITCDFDLTGAEAGVWDVVVENPDNQNAVLQAAFTITEPAPAITSITPDKATNDGYVTITNLKGNYFQEGAEVSLSLSGELRGSTGANRAMSIRQMRASRKGSQYTIPAIGVVVHTSTRIACSFNLGNAPTGTWDLSVLNPDNQSSTYPGIFTITYPPPVITAIAPATGNNHEIVQITALTGTGFMEGITVKLTMEGQPDILAAEVVLATSGVDRIFSGRKKDGVLKRDIKRDNKGDNKWDGKWDGNSNYRTGFRDRIPLMPAAGDEAPTGLTCTFDLIGAEPGLWNLYVENPDGQSYVLNRGFTVVEKTYSLNVNAIPAGRGTVTIVPDKALYVHGESVTLTAEPDSGEHFYRWGGGVSAGHEGSNPVTVTMEEDKTIDAYFVLPPEVAILSPSNGAWVAGIVEISARATGTGGIAQVAFYIDGQLKHTDSAEPYVYNWNTAEYGPGAHVIEVKAIDNFGLGSTRSITVYRDAPPTVYLTVPAEGATVHGLVTISAYATDDRGIDKLKFYIDGQLMHTVNAASGEFNWDSTPFLNSMHNITVRAVDSSGQTNSERIEVEVLNVNITLQVTREIETIWVAQKEYGRIAVTLNKQSLEVSRYVIYRKEGNGEYRELRPASGIGDLAQGGVFYDKYLEKGVNYTYKVHAYDSGGMLVGISGERTI